MTFSNEFIVCLAALYIIAGYTYNSNAHDSNLQSEQPKNEPSGDCLNCICEAMSSCNSSTGCSGGVCGIFKITRDYWIDSGRPVKNGDNPKNNNAFEKCATDPKCARKSTTNYLTRFAQDCNNDGTIDCSDYAAIHMQGGYGCSDPLDGNYKSVYEDCMYHTLVNEVFSKDVPPQPLRPSTNNPNDDRVIFPNS
ncbi:Destabilase,EF-Hand 1, calcium-binding site [Cinara cedri]|uniref:lysozyme n=1 Tax=Cinara cedri TaxID=506608 RepID=A0A5E4NED7_9HEMI|nr:Destabilase,EF-Hand 1, calcium-binding site [Cinara cedri]